MSLISTPSLAAVTINVADGGGPGCEWREQGVLLSWDGHGAPVRNHPCYAEPLRFLGCYRYTSQPVLTNTPSVPGKDRIQEGSF